MLADWNPRNPRPYLRKWIESRVGLPWDDTYSILCSTFKRPFLRYQMERILGGHIDLHVIYGEDGGIYPHDAVGKYYLRRGALYVDREGILRIVEKSPNYVREKVKIRIKYKDIIYTYNNYKWTYERRTRKLVKKLELTIRDNKPVFVKVCNTTTHKVSSIPLLLTTYETQVDIYDTPTYIENRLNEILIQELERRESNKENYSPLYKIWFDQLPPDTSAFIERLRLRKG